MKRYSMTSLRTYSPAEDPDGDFVKHEEFVERERYWRDWNGRAANRAAVLEAQIEKYEMALHSIAENTCCETCREAALVARQALYGCEGKE